MRGSGRTPHSRKKYLVQPRYEDDRWIYVDCLFDVLSEYSPKQYTWAVKENYQVWIKTKRKKAKDLSRGSADQRRSKGAVHGYFSGSHHLGSAVNVHPCFCAGFSFPLSFDSSCMKILASAQVRSSTHPVRCQIFMPQLSTL